MEQDYQKLRKYARYGPDDRYLPIPGAGFCLSVFAVIRKEGEDCILVGIPKKVRRWRDDWLYAKRKDEGAEVFDEWRLPSCYLKEGENPEDAFGRILKGQLGIRKINRPLDLRALSYFSPSDWYKGKEHWDLALVYSIKLPEEAISSRIARKWWRKIGFFRRDVLSSKDYGWNHDLMTDLDLI